jgi:outer membrane protein TolC
MRSKNVIFFIFFLLNFVIISAQNQKSITLENVLSKVATNNYTIKISNEDFKAAKAEFNQTNAIILPSISISHTGITTTNPLMAFGSKLNQEILTPTDFDPSLLNNPTEIQNYATKIEIKQPILNFDGMLMRKAAKAKMTAQNLNAKRTKKYITLEVKKAFMQLQVAYKAVEVLNKAKEAALTNKKIAKNNFKQGYLQNADLLSVEIYATEVENQLLSAKSALKNASDYLHYLMGDKDLALLKPVNNLKAKVNTSLYNQTPSNQRDDIEAMKKSTEAYNYMYKASKNTYLPNLNAFGSYELYDNHLFGTSAKGYVLGAQLSWNVFEGFKRIGKVQQRKADFDKAQLNLEQYKNKSQLDFNKAKRQLKDAENKLTLTYLAVQQSKEELRIRTNRFEQGLEKTSDLLNTQTKYLQKQLENLQTVFNYNYTKAYVEFLLN